MSEFHIVFGEPSLQAIKAGRDWSDIRQRILLNIFVNSIDRGKDPGDEASAAAADFLRTVLLSGKAPGLKKRGSSLIDRECNRMADRAKAMCAIESLPAKARKSTQAVKHVAKMTGMSKRKTWDIVPSLLKTKKRGTKGPSK